MDSLTRKRECADALVWCVLVVRTGRLGLGYRDARNQGETGSAWQTSTGRGAPLPLPPSINAPSGFACWVGGVGVWASAPDEAHADQDDGQAGPPLARPERLAVHVNSEHATRAGPPRRLASSALKSSAAGAPAVPARALEPTAARVVPHLDARASGSSRRRALLPAEPPFPWSALAGRPRRRTVTNSDDQRPASRAFRPS